MEDSSESLYGKIVGLLDALQARYLAEGGESSALPGAWILDRFYPEADDPLLRLEEDPHKVRALVIQRWASGRLCLETALARHAATLKS